MRAAARVSSSSSGRSGHIKHDLPAQSLQGPSLPALSLAVLLLSTAAAAHPQGFHTRLTFTVSKYAVEGLVVMDVDSGARCQLIRAGADEDHDGVLSGPELERLKARLVAMATKNLKLAISSFPLPLTLKDTKLSLREDHGVSDTGLSVAVLLELKHPHAVTPGMSFEVEDTSPDLSPVVLEVFQATSEPSGEPPVRVELPSGQRQRVRLGVLEAKE